MILYIPHMHMTTAFEGLIIELYSMRMHEEVLSIISLKNTNIRWLQAAKLAPTLDQESY
jgi:hypothetical protein